MDLSSSNINTSQLNKIDLEPTAGLSSAAACINFQYSNSNINATKQTSTCFNFNPVYTHQIFDSNEVIRGYQPFPDAQQKSMNIAKKIRTDQLKNNGNNDNKNNNNNNNNNSHCLHSSFQHPHHVNAKSYLSIQIKLAPSCKNCNIIISTTCIDENNDENNKNEKTTDSKENLDEKNGGIKRKLSSLEPPMPRPLSVLSVDDIIKSLSKGLPTIVNKKDENNNDDDDTGGYLSTPIGTPLFEYQNNNKDTFVLCFANGNDENVSTYHNQVQKLAIWFIENSDDVDLTSDEGGGSWKVLYLFQKQHSINKCSVDNEKDDGNGTESNKCNFQYSLVGYMTLFAFYSPFKKPKPGIVLRICQVLIIPPYQRSGHGKLFVRAVYDYSNGKFDDKVSKSLSESSLEVVEINVEDPAPGFQTLRNHVDYEMFHENYKASSISENTNNNEEQNNVLFLPLKYYKNTFLEPICDYDATNAASKAKISKTQIHIAYEIYKLNTIMKLMKEDGNNGVLSSSSSSSETIEKNYRLMVKKRLNSYHCEEIGACSTKDEKKKKLGELYDDTVLQYRNILLSSR